MKRGRRYLYWIRLIVLIFLAAALNCGLSTFLSIFKIPLFLDTVFNAAICFAFGLLPGLLTIVATQILASLSFGSGLSPFILCSIAEVVLVWRLNPDYPLGAVHPMGAAHPVGAVREEKSAALVTIVAGLLLLYIVCLITISVLGGLIDFLYYGIWRNPKPYLSTVDILKLGLSRSGIPTLAVDIVSRISINMVDRFIVVFGGFFISMGVKKINIEK
ncbi:hypothetical protein R84B8_01380 [Treponema sp. R8-4-B8]